MTAIAAVALGALAVAAMQPRVTGQFHDDGLYLATARSLADGDGYRHASLPTTPAQTKYPPLYPLGLAAILKLAPGENLPVGLIKGTSAVVLVVSVLLAGLLGRRILGGRLAPATFAFLVGASPLVFPFTDYAVTELPFLCLCLAAALLAPGIGGIPGGDAGGEDGGLETREHRSASGGPGARSRLALALGITCGLAFLVRQAALPLIVAGVATYALRREGRRLAAFLLPVAVLTLPWLWFKTVHAPEEPNVLLAYYTGYEPSVLHIGFGDPGLALGIFLDNAGYLWDALEAAVHIGTFPALGILFYPVAALGAWVGLRRRGIGFWAIFSVLYAGLILLWPWHPARYAVPLAPLVPLALLLGCRRMSAWLAEPDAKASVRLARRAVSWSPAILLLGLSLGWLGVYATPAEGRTRMAFLAFLDYDWAGFEETAAWIRENTTSTDVLATAYDPTYYLLTDRRGVRPWIHRPWTYFYPRDEATPDLGSVAEIRPALDELGARYLVVDPLEGYLEREAAARLFDALLASYGGVGAPGGPSLRFVSSDSLHFVYELPRPDDGGRSDAAPATNARRF